uniref:Uncharacterized protein n=1 Tax=Vespula pensylvanica TaxID=30213 RepID=A0A834UF45_VESPE|nr:hypothetical protein H0235_003317 [Vespula pensylvanica]
MQKPLKIKVLVYFEAGYPIRKIPCPTSLVAINDTAGVFKRSSTWPARSISDRDRHPGLAYRISNVGGPRCPFRKDESKELHKRLPPRRGVSFCIMKSLNYTKEKGFCDGALDKDYSIA